MQKCDGVKILDLEEKELLTGTEYLVTAEKGENHKIPLNAVTDTIINSSKFKAAIAEVYESSTPTASVTLNNDQFLFSFGIPAGRRGDNGKDGRDGIDGKDGKDGIPGMPGIDGNTTRLVIAFKSTSTAEAPDTPIGGGWDYATNIVTYPEGWSGSDNNPHSYLWMSNATFSSNGTIVTNWSNPVLFSGKDGKNGKDGNYCEYRFLRNDSYDVSPTLNTKVRYPDGWSMIAPPSSNGKVLWATFAHISGVDNSLIEPGWCEPYYMTGSTGAAGIPGVGYEIRYCKGTETTYTGEVWNDTMKTKREPEGWFLTCPELVEDDEYNYIWYILVRVIDDQLEDGQYWSKPNPLGGIITSDPIGQQPIAYPMGIYDINVVYTNNGEKAPYVYDTTDGNYYFLKLVTTWIGTQHDNISPAADKSGVWTVLEGYEAIYTDLLIAPNSLVGGAVFNNNLMFSQKGKDSSNNTVTTYQNINVADPMNTSNSFRPNFLLDFSTGEAYFNAGGVHLSGSDESYIKLKNGSFNTILNKTGLSITGGDLELDVIAINNNGLYVDMPTNDSNLRHTTFSVNTDCAQMYSTNTTATEPDFDFNTIQHFKFNTDGSGEMANGNIKWNNSGEVDIRITSLVDEFNPAESVGYIDLPTLKENESRSYFLDTPTFSLNYTGHAIHGTFNNLTVYTMPANYGDDYIKETITSESNPKKVILPGDSVLIVHGNCVGGNSSWKITQIARRSW